MDEMETFLAAKVLYYDNLVLLAKQGLRTHPFNGEPFHEKMQAYKSLLTLIEETQESKDFERLERKALERFEKASSRYKKDIYAAFFGLVQKARESSIKEPEIVPVPEVKEKVPLSEEHRVKKQNARARTHGLVATLELWQWEATLEYFHGLCAYCQRRCYARMDHFVPISKGGGTTWDNCVPACDLCDSEKKMYDPDHANNIAQSDIERVRTYLLNIARKNA